MKFAKNSFQKDFTEIAQKFYRLKKYHFFFKKDLTVCLSFSTIEQDMIGKKHYPS